MQDSNCRSEQNMLPYDGEVLYQGLIMDKQEADYLLSQLMSTIEWRNDEAILFGKKIVTNRKVAWYADLPLHYTYSKITKVALPWTELLLTIKKLVEDKSNETYNSCLLNLYHNEREGMAWHSDGEPDLKKHGTIASITFGAERKFLFKHKYTKINVGLILEHGSLLLMKGSTQEHWLHRLPTSRRPFGPRINLTFRTVVK